MMAFVALRIQIVCVLVISIGHVPVPWVHRHQGIEHEYLARHVQAYHCQVAECDLPAGWHIHFYCFGLSSAYPGHGWRTPPSPIDDPLCEDTNPLAFEPESNRSVEYLSDSDRPAVSDPVVAAGCGEPAALFGSTVDFFCAGLRAENRRYQDLCMLLL